MMLSSVIIVTGHFPLTLWDLRFLGEVAKTHTPYIGWDISSKLTQVPIGTSHDFMSILPSISKKTNRLKV